MIIIDKGTINIKHYLLFRLFSERSSNKKVETVQKYYMSFHHKWSDEQSIWIDSFSLFPTLFRRPAIPFLSFLPPTFPTPTFPFLTFPFPLFFLLVFHSYVSYFSIWQLVLLFQHSKPPRFTRQPTMQAIFLVPEQRVSWLTGPRRRGYQLRLYPTK